MAASRLDRPASACTSYLQSFSTRLARTFSAAQRKWKLYVGESLLEGLRQILLPAKFYWKAYSCSTHTVVGTGLSHFYWLAEGCSEHRQSPKLTRLLTYTGGPIKYGGLFHVRGEMVSKESMSAATAHAAASAATSKSASSNSTSSFSGEASHQ